MPENKYSNPSDFVLMESLDLDCSTLVEREDCCDGERVVVFNAPRTTEYMRQWIKERHG